MERAKTESEKETPIGHGRLIADMMRKPPRHFQCRVCGYKFKMLPCAHGLRGKDLTCPKCGENSKELMTTVVKGIANRRTVRYVGSVKDED